MYLPTWVGTLGKESKKAKEQETRKSIPPVQYRRSDDEYL